ncbi:MAG: helix-turn-helix transcriptional regulator [Haloarculaceae archaeon]
MESALAEIEFLALSPNRVAVLRRLADGPHTRSDLAAATGASQATLGRILSDFEERSWIERDGGTYTATATGRLVAEGFTDLLDVVETERELRGVVDYLPASAMDFDLRRLADATVTVPTETRPDAPMQRSLDLLDGADEVLGFSHAFNERNLGTIHDRVTRGEQTFRGVFSRSAIDALADDSRLRQRLVALDDADGGAIRVSDREIPVAVIVIDDMVHLLVRDDDGVLRASVDTDDPAVRSWATDRFGEYWDGATPLARSDRID